MALNKEGLNAGNSDFLSDALLYNALSFGAYAKPWVGSTATNDEMASVFGRINYIFKRRYLLTATLRADGCSYFAKGHQWGYFPSVAAAWRFSDEPFLASASDWFSNGKLRLSWGQTGNSSIGYQSVSLYSDRDSWGNRFNKDFGGTEHIGFQLTQLGNPDITWETTTEWNLGLDLGFLNNRISVSADLYWKEISNLLNWRPLRCPLQVLWRNILSPVYHPLPAGLRPESLGQLPSRSPIRAAPVCSHRPLHSGHRHRLRNPAPLRPPRPQIPHRPLPARP